MNSKISIVLLLALVFSAPLWSQEDEEEVNDYMEGPKENSFVYINEEGKKGFMFGLNIGIYLANQTHATFYDGSPKGDGFLDLANYVNLPQVRQDIVNSLGGGINPESITFAGYGESMRYNRPLMIGANLRYQFNWYGALIADFNFVTLRPSGLWAISYPPTNGASQQIFQNYAISGKEERLMINLGYQVPLAEPGPLTMHVEGGPLLTSIRIRENRFTAGSGSYNILRAQNTGVGNQILNNGIPTKTFIGAYGQVGFNMEFDKFTIDLGWRTSWENIDLGNPTIEEKRRLEHAPFMRLVYRTSVRGF